LGPPPPPPLLLPCPYAVSHGLLADSQTSASASGLPRIMAELAVQLEAAASG